MKMSSEISIVNIVFLLLVVPFSMLMEGFRRKLVARMQNRKGPPVWQVFYDVAKLIRKGKTDSLARKNVLFRIAPMLYLASTLVLFLIVPFSILSFEYDFILLVYLLVLSSALYILAGFASNNPYSTISAMRELILVVTYEMVFTISLITVFVYTNSISFAALDASLLLVKLPLAAFCFASTLLVETRITPFDTVEAGTEVLEGIKTEYAGRNLALLEIAKDLKQVFFAMLFIVLFIGRLDLIGMILGTMVMIFWFAFSLATTCRYRVDQAFLAFRFILILAVIEFIRIHFIIW